jgi:hypothetical protein
MEVSLDLVKVVSQVETMVARLKAGVNKRQAHLQQALNIIKDEATDLDYLRRKIASSKTTWLVAGLVGGLARHYKAPPCPPEFTVVATDGSHIDVDRHQSTRCYLINIGNVILSYGTQPDAILDNSPLLYFGDEDLVIAPTGVTGREQPIEGVLLGIRRGVEECRQLAELAAELPQGSSNLALLDGSLILWGLAGKAYPEFVTEALLKDGFLVHLDAMRKLNSDKRLALASYISFPRSTDVVNVLRLALCPHEVADCDRYCPQKRDCDAVSGIQDRELFSHILEEGGRSTVFFSRSSVVQKHYGEHQVYFFYLRTDDEIARVEIPQWVATDETLLNLAHALVLDQCQRGHGYPVALSEAHEKAVVTGADREQFWQLVESSLVGEHMETPGSAKSRSKRTRWI